MKLVSKWKYGDLPKNAGNSAEDKIRYQEYIDACIELLKTQPDDHSLEGGNSTKCKITLLTLKNQGILNNFGAQILSLQTNSNELSKLNKHELSIL